MVEVVHFSNVRPELLFKASEDIKRLSGHWFVILGDSIYDRFVMKEHAEDSAINLAMYFS